MFNSAYTYHFRTDSGIRFLCIVDMNQGMSITNNIENVVAQIAKQENVDPATLVIIYQDSSGMWDGWSHAQQDFFHLSAVNENRAVAKFLEGIKNTL